MDTLQDVADRLQWMAQNAADHFKLHWEHSAEGKRAKYQLETFLRMHEIIVKHLATRKEQ